MAENEKLDSAGGRAGAGHPPGRHGWVMLSSLTCESLSRASVGCGHDGADTWRARCVGVETVVEGAGCAGV